MQVPLISENWDCCYRWTEIRGCLCTSLQAYLNLSSAKVLIKCLALSWLKSITLNLAFWMRVFVCAVHCRGKGWYYYPDLISEQSSSPIHIPWGKK